MTDIEQMAGEIADKHYGGTEKESLEAGGHVSWTNCYLCGIEMAKAMQQEWVSVETKPSNKRDVLVRRGDNYAVAYYSGFDWTPSNVETTYDMAGVILDFEPIEWSELLPQPPKEAD